MHNQRNISFSEGYKLMRRVGADPVASVFMAFVWVLRGDTIDDDSQ